MKKLFIALMAIAILVSCKDKKNSGDKKTENRETDDYQKKDVDKKDEDKTADFKNEDNDDNGKMDDLEKNDDKTSFSGAKEWPQSERTSFVTSCIREAVNGGTSRPIAQKYCDCMLIKVEGLYPDINEAANLNDQQLENIITRFRDECLK